MAMYWSRLLDGARRPHANADTGGHEAPALPSAFDVATEDARPRDRLFAAAVMFLLVPAALVLWYFARYPLVALLAAIVALPSICKSAAGSSGGVAAGLKATWPMLALAMLATWLSGVLPPFAQNSDWIKHYGLLNLLAGQPWPPLVLTEEGIGVLRYSIGFYVVPALVGKVSGFVGTMVATAVLTAAGLYMAMLLAFGHKLRTAQAAFALGGLLLLFSGADLIGYYITGVRHGPMLHLEWWWTPFGELASILTNFLWTPQHTLPGLLGAFLVLRYPRAALANAGVIGAALAIWSPFAAVGVVPLFVRAIAREGLRPLWGYSNLLAAPVLLYSAGSFLLAGSSSIPAQFIWHVDGFTLGQWITFLAVEVLVLALALWIASPRNRGLIATCVLTLVALACFRVGEYNDLLMRGSIPALGVLAALAAEALVYGAAPARKILLVACLLVGAVTPLGEVMRALMAQRLVEPQHGTLNAVIGGRPALARQYLVYEAPDRYATHTVLQRQDLVFSPFGTAAFDPVRGRVESNDYADAALVTQPIVLPAGFYRLDATLAWDVQAMTPGKHGGHLSLHGTRLLHELNGAGAGEPVSAYFQSNGEAFQVAFGLGGWTQGRGFVELKDLRISRVTRR